MSYAQTHYDHKIGGSDYTIAQRGSLITAFCNLLEKFGEGITPVALNSYFTETNTYLQYSTGSNDDLTWGAIGRYDGNIAVGSIGGDSLPSSTAAIVRFDTTPAHYCAVDHLENNQVYIIDSLDGQVKGPGAYLATYGKPVAWATFVRNVNDVPEPEVELPEAEPEPPKDHKFAHAPVVAKLQTQRILVKTDLATYADPGHAARRQKPLPKKLPQGMQEFDLLKQGMLRIAGTTTWINPADNVLKPLASPRKDTRGNFTWFIEPVKYKANNGYMKNHSEGEVFSWTDKANAKIKYNQPVWVAGTCVDGEQLYAIPANPKADGSFAIMKEYGILLSYLSPVQLDYQPDDPISDVEPAEAAALVPRPVSLKDNVELTKFKVQKLVDNFVRRL